MTDQQISPTRRKPPRRHRQPVEMQIVDLHVGRRVRLRRTLLGMSQERLGTEIELTFQQVQKYERGANRISASMLWKLGRVLDVPVSFFFDDMPTNVAAAPSPAHPDEPMMRRETLELVRAYYLIAAEKRRHVYGLVKTMAAAEKPHTQR